MRIHQLFIACAFVPVVNVSAASASDVVRLRCEFAAVPNGLQAHFSDVIVDQRGISITDFTKNEKTGQIEYVKNYTEIKKDDTSESYYRMNSAEVAWGSQHNLFGTIVN